MIQEAYCSYEIAKLLKEKGFNIPTQFVWYENSLYKAGEHSIDFFFLTDDVNDDRFVRYSNNDKILSYISGEVFSCPTHQLAMTWIREMYDLHIIAYPYKAFNEKKYCCQVYQTFNLLGCEKYTNERLDSYEEAVEAALLYCLTNLI